MFDLGISKLVLIAVVALIVLGPEKLPRVARTVGALLGKAQRYVNDVKAEVNRSMELDELRKAKEDMENAAHSLNQTVRTHASDYKKTFAEIQQAAALENNPLGTSGDAFAATDHSSAAVSGLTGAAAMASAALAADQPQDASKREFVRAVVPVYTQPRKNWRVQRTATPHWYKARHLVRQKVQSNAARLASKPTAARAKQTTI